MILPKLLVPQVGKLSSRGRARLLNQHLVRFPPNLGMFTLKPGPGAPKGIPDSGWRPKEALQSLLFPVGLEMKSHPFLFRFNPSQYIKNKFLHSIRREKANSYGRLPWWYRGRIGIHLPMQGTQFRSLIWKDSTGHGEPQLLSPSSRALEPQLLKSVSLASVLPNRGSHCKEKPKHCNQKQPPLTVTRQSLQQ